MDERAQLEQSITRLEDQRAVLGDAAADTALDALREKLAALEDAENASGPEAAAPEMAGERKLVTIMFVDMAGFTSLAETMDPEAVRNLVNTCFEALVPVIETYGGTVTKFIGDAIESVFGAPVAHENDPERALSCALEIMDAMARFNAAQGTDLGLHLGINTGLVIAGGIGSTERQDYAVTGDAINLAARLEDASERGEILVGPDTYRLTSSSFAFETLAPIRVQGKREPVQVYRLVGRKEEQGRKRWLDTQRITSPLVGREAEFSSVTACIERLNEGQGGLLFLTGEAGLGKSRLMAEVRKRTLSGDSDPPLRWLEGRALSFGETMSYWPFQGILWQWAGITEEDSEAQAWDKLQRRVWALFARDTGEVLPYLASLLSLEVRAPYADRVKHLDGDAMGHQIYLTSRRFFERLAQERPLVLVFEDLHWVDRSSAELLEHLLPLVERVPLLICIVSRSGSETPAMHLREVSAREHASCYTEVRLAPLSQAESRQLIDNLLQIDDLSPQAREMIAGKAEGNPFFVEEIVRALIDAGAVVRDRSTGQCRATEQVESITIPDTIQGVIMARVDRLDEDVKDVLRTAAVIGRSFFYRVLRAVAEADQVLDGRLAELQAVELIREKRGGPELEYIFKHALAQEATYESILLERRRALHGQVGEAIETIFGDRLEEFYGLLAYHYARAEAWEKAQEYLLKAADQAGRVAADAEALAHYEQAMAAYERAFGDRWDPLQRAALERKMGEAFFRRGDLQHAMEHLERALALLGRPLPASRPGVRWAIAREAAAHVAHRLLPGLFLKPPGGPVSPAVEHEINALRNLRWKSLSGDWELFFLTSLRMANRSGRAGYLSGLVRGLSTMAACFDLVPVLWLAKGYHRRSLALAKESQDPALLGSAYVSCRYHEWNQGNWDAAVEIGRRGAESCLEAGNLDAWGNGVRAVIFSLAYKGDFAEALRLSEELIRVAEEGDARHLLCWGLQEQGRIHRLRGHWDEARSALQRSAALAATIPDHRTHMEAYGQLGQLYLEEGNLVQAFASLRESQRLHTDYNIFSPITSAPLRNGLAQAHLVAAERGDGKERDNWLRKAKGACRAALKNGKAFRGALPEAMRLQGTYEWLRGKRAAARKWWQRSINLAEELGQPYDLGMAHLEMGRRLGDTSHLALAEALFAEIGAEWDLAQAQEALGKTE